MKEPDIASSQQKLVFGTLADKAFEDAVDRFSGNAVAIGGLCDPMASALCVNFFALDQSTKATATGAVLLATKNPTALKRKRVCQN